MSIPSLWTTHYVDLGGCSLQSDQKTIGKLFTDRQLKDFKKERKCKKPVLKTKAKIKNRLTSTLLVTCKHMDW